MNLQTYRTTVAKLSREKAGAQLGVDGITVWRWETGRSVPEAPRIRRIIEWSGGQVTADDVLAANYKPAEGVESEGGEA